MQLVIDEIPINTPPCGNSEQQCFFLENIFSLSHKKPIRCFAKKIQWKFWELSSSGAWMVFMVKFNKIFLKREKS